ncbi:MAG: HAMP domain-containing sensor histidine kinase [Anaerolineae bacterium]|nr:HAMP domain-containing sensor histidine kinase [Anaerolineae bacterium]
MTDTENPLAAARQALVDARNQLSKVQQALEQLDTLLEQAESQRAAQTEQHVKLVSTIVHELRKPMTSIRGYADMLAKPNMVGTLNPMQQNFVETIRNNIVRMDWLLSDISDINKLQAQRLRLERKMLTFESLRGEIEAAVSSLVSEYGHTLTIQIEPELPVINTDPKQLVKVIVLLLRNAIFYTPKGTGQLLLKAEPTGRAGEMRISVCDNGIGMRPEDVARLGELFFRADHELVTNTKGYGLGIPVVKGLLALMDSQLEVQSALGQGSTFSFRLQGI